MAVGYFFLPSAYYESRIKFRILRPHIAIVDVTVTAIKLIPEDPVSGYSVLNMIQIYIIMCMVKDITTVASLFFDLYIIAVHYLVAERRRHAFHVYVIVAVWKQAQYPNVDNGKKL